MTTPMEKPVSFAIISESEQLVQRSICITDRLGDTSNILHIN